MTARNATATGYLELTERDPSLEIGTWASELTVTETYFLRHAEQFTALTQAVLPDRRRAGADPARLRVLSAGCATGEEPYSIALALRQHNPAAQPSILGVDVNPVALGHAHQARYSPWSLRAIPAHVRARWFTVNGQHAVLDPALQKLVRFEQSNLAQDDRAIWQPDHYDVVFCRNVLMYLAPEVMANVVARIARSLQPGGFLFLGSAETLRGLATSFELRESHGVFYYQHGQTSGRRPIPPPLGIPAPHRPVIRTAVRKSGVQKHPVQKHPAGESPDLVAVLDLFGQERFTEALAQAEALLSEVPGPAPADAGLLLLRAALLTHSGRMQDAERACQDLLAIESVSAGAHLLLAIVRECEDDTEAAMTHCRAASSRDPRFAMPHVHLARLSSKAGRTQAVRRHFVDAIQLLPAETDRRIMLFGGGFGREALISFCRTQLAQLELR